MLAKLTSFDTGSFGPDHPGETSTTRIGREQRLISFTPCGSFGDLGQCWHGKLVNGHRVASVTGQHQKVAVSFLHAPFDGSSVLQS